MPPADFGGLLAKAKTPATPVVPALEPVESMEEDPERDRMLPIAEDIIAAVKGGDASALADALIAANRSSGHEDMDVEE